MLQIMEKQSSTKIFFTTFADLTEEYSMILGDFNVVSNHKMDKSKNNYGAKIPKVAWKNIEQLDLVDIWRHRNSKARKYTFYSDRHDSYSRIDQIWLSKSMIPSVHDTEILPNIFADHSPVEISFWFQRPGLRR